LLSRRTDARGGDCHFAVGYWPYCGYQRYRVKRTKTQKYRDVAGTVYRRTYRLAFTLQFGSTITCYRNHHLYTGINCRRVTGWFWHATRFRLYQRTWYLR